MISLAQTTRWLWRYLQPCTHYNEWFHWHKPQDVYGECLKLILIIMNDFTGLKPQYVHGDTLSFYSL